MATAFRTLVETILGAIFETIYIDGNKLCIYFPFCFIPFSESQNVGWAKALSSPPPPTTPLCSIKLANLLILGNLRLPPLFQSMSARKTRNEIITTSFWRINSRFSRWSTYLHLRGIQWVEIIYDEVVLLLLLHVYILFKFVPKDCFMFQPIFFRSTSMYICKWREIFQPVRIIGRVV